MPLILSGNVASATAGAYSVANSCRFDGSSSKLVKAQSAGNRDLWTYSVWIKWSAITTTTTTFFASSDGSNLYAYMGIQSYKIRFLDYSSGNQTNLITNRAFRDPSAWYHVVLAYDSAQGTDSNRVKLYINGVQETSFSTETYPSSGLDSAVNVDSSNFIISSNQDQLSGSTWNGYMAEACFIDGQALAPTSFGEFDEDSPTIWKPINVSGLTFGTNGFYLDFEASDNLGNDKNGGTDLTESGLAATDQTTDTPTNNFAVLNPLTPQVHTLSEGNLQVDGTASNWDSLFSTIGVANGKWYMELKFLALEGGLRRATIGLVDVRGVTQFATDGLGYTVTNALGDSVGYNGNGTSNTVKKNDGAEYNGIQWDVDDIICMAVDCDNGAVYFRINGDAWQNSGDPTSGASRTGAVTITTGETYVLGATAYGSSTQFTLNFGNPPYANSSSVADADGYGAFEFAPPSGYFALCTKNLAEYG